MPSTLTMLTTCFLLMLASAPSLATYRVPVRVFIDMYEEGEYGKNEEERIKHVTAIVNLVKERFEGLVKTGVKLVLEGVHEMEKAKSNGILGRSRIVFGPQSKIAKLKQEMEKANKTLPNGITLLVTPRNLGHDDQAVTGVASTENICSGAYVILHSVHGSLKTYDAAPRLFAKMLGSASEECNKADDGTSHHHAGLSECLQGVSSGIQDLECLKPQEECWRDGDCYPHVLPGDGIAEDGAFCGFYNPEFRFEEEAHGRECHVKCCGSSGCGYYPVLDGMSCWSDPKKKCVNFQCRQ